MKIIYLNGKIETTILVLGVIGLFVVFFLVVKATDKIQQNLLAKIDASKKRGVRPDIKSTLKKVAALYLRIIFVGLIVLVYVVASVTVLDLVSST